jgi:hypothetical protein
MYHYYIELNSRKVRVDSCPGVNRYFFVEVCPCPCPCPPRVCVLVRVRVHFHVHVHEHAYVFVQIHDIYMYRNMKTDQYVHEYVHGNEY